MNNEKIAVTAEQVQALESLNAATAAANLTFNQAYSFHMQKSQEIESLRQQFWNGVCTQFGFKDVAELDGKGWQITTANEYGKYVFVKTQKPGTAAMDVSETKQ